MALGLNFILLKLPFVKIATIESLNIMLIYYSDN
jgi:hypothetical protein